MEALISSLPDLYKGILLGALTTSALLIVVWRYESFGVLRPQNDTSASSERLGLLSQNEEEDQNEVFSNTLALIKLCRTSIAKKHVSL
jgi:hypothetical protein